MLSRRNFLASAAAIVAFSGVGYAYTNRKPSTGSQTVGYEVTRTPKEWKEILTPDQFAVLRQEATERAGTSPLLNEKRQGTFHCAACELPAYRSETKYESGTGWPSFYAAMENAVLTKTDYKSLFPRTEVHCSRCGGHFGHIFNDGPKPTGKRHCLNGVALSFIADA